MCGRSTACAVHVSSQSSSHVYHASMLGDGLVDDYYCGLGPSCCSTRTSVDGHRVSDKPQIPEDAQSTGLILPACQAPCVPCHHRPSKAESDRIGGHSQQSLPRSPCPRRRGTRTRARLGGPARIVAQRGCCYSWRPHPQPQASVGGAGWESRRRCCRPSAAALIRPPPCSSAPWTPASQRASPGKMNHERGSRGHIGRLTSPGPSLTNTLLHLLPSSHPFGPS